MQIDSSMRRMLLLLVVLALSACGMRGPLYFPEDAPADRRVDDRH